MGAQLRVLPDHRAGFRARACRYRACRAVRTTFALPHFVRARHARLRWPTKRIDGLTQMSGTELEQPIVARRTADAVNHAQVTTVVVRSAVGLEGPSAAFALQ
jgi:hypothetical protein